MYQAIQREGKEAVPLMSEEYVVKVMPAILGNVDMTATYLVAIFFIVNAATAAAGGAAAFTYLILGAVTFFIPSAIATAQLGHMFPNEGSLYNWTHKALGGYWSLFVALCAWFPGVLVMIAGADIVITTLQGINSHWLVEPWQQGSAIMVILALSALLALQRFRMTQNIVNIAIAFILVAVVLIGLSAVTWLFKGNHSATNFSHLGDWSINWNPTRGNLSLFGLITLAYLGTEVPLNMGGEITKRSVVSRHLLWGTILVLIGYFIATAALLIVQGPSASNSGGFSLITNVDMTLGKFAGDITAICILFFFIIVPVVYNYAFARLLLVGGIDQRLPMRVGKLNKNRVPANAIIFQTVVAILLTSIIFMIVPYIARLGNPADLAREVYSVVQAAATLVWAIATAFLFINLVCSYVRDRVFFRQHRIIPMPILLISVVVGPVSCLTAIIDTLLFSWIGTLISNNQWWFIIGSTTAICLLIAAIGSIFAFAVSEANWQGFSSKD